MNARADSEASHPFSRGEIQPALREASDGRNPPTQRPTPSPRLTPGRYDDASRQPPRAELTAPPAAPRFNEAVTLREWRNWQTRWI